MKSRLTDKYRYSIIRINKRLILISIQIQTESYNHD